MGSRLRTLTLALGILSACLSVAMIGTAGRGLYVYYHERHKNRWFLPLWPQHFDSRELQVLIGTSGSVFVLNMILAVALVATQLPANIIVLGSALLSTLVMLVSVVSSTMINNRAPYKDTLQTWTCRWSAMNVAHGKGAPGQFQGLCYETRFAYYSTIPLMVLQVVLFALALYVVFSRPHDRHEEIEKQSGYPLHGVHNIPNEPYQTRVEYAKGYEHRNGYHEKALPETPKFQFGFTEPTGNTPRSSLLEAVLRRSN